MNGLLTSTPSECSDARYSYSYSRKLVSRHGLTADACYIYKSGQLYQGKKLWSVKHPAYFECLVFAPDYVTAIQTSARLYGADWKKYDFYGYCDCILL